MTRNITLTAAEAAATAVTGLVDAADLAAVCRGRLADHSYGPEARASALQSLWSAEVLARLHGAVRDAVAKGQDHHSALLRFVAHGAGLPLLPPDVALKVLADIQQALRMYCHQETPG